jgi:hypothetical protein
LQFNCLISPKQNLDDNSMSDECEDRLLEIQYFMAREWSLDPKLVRACDADVKNLYVDMILVHSILFHVCTDVARIRSGGSVHLMSKVHIRAIQYCRVCIDTHILVSLKIRNQLAVVMIQPILYVLYSIEIH